MKKVLLVAYHFPPIRVSSGIQRTLSLTRYLNDSGWQPSVLTISPKAYVKTSNSQLDDIPDHIKVTRAAGWDTARHFSIGGQYLRFMALPDRWVSWIFGGIVSGLRMIRRDKPSLIWSTYPIATAHLIALSLHRITGLPWVADFRDSMTEDDYPSNPAQRRTYRWIERQTVKSASRIIFTTQGTRQMYQERYPEADPDLFEVVPNGYDESIFRTAESALTIKPKEPGKITLIHSGVLYPSERDPTAFFNALAELKKSGQINADNLHIILRATGHDDTFQPMLKDRSIEDLVSLEPGVDYIDALQEMLSVDGLLLFQAANCNHQIPAKLYEYFRAGKPILAFTDKKGNTAQSLLEAGIGNIADLDNSGEIQKCLIRFIAEINSGSCKIADSEITSSYSRQALTASFARIFNAVNSE